MNLKVLYPYTITVFIIGAMGVYLLYVEQPVQRSELISEKDISEKDRGNLDKRTVIEKLHTSDIGFPEQMIFTGKRRLIIYAPRHTISKEVIRIFEKTTGIPVIIKEFNTETQKIALMQSFPVICDLILAPLEIARLLGEKLKLTKHFDKNKISNLKFLKRDFIEKVHFGIPMEFILLTMAVNTNYVNEFPKTWKFLYNSKYKGKISLLDSPLNLISTLLLINSSEIIYKNTRINMDSETEHYVSFDKLRNIIADLKRQDIKLKSEDENLRDIMSGKKWIVQLYGYHSVAIAKDYPKIKFFVPKGGSVINEKKIYILCFSLSKFTRHAEEAHQFVNFMLMPDISARQTNTLFVATAVDADMFINDYLLDNRFIYPDDIFYKPKIESGKAQVTKINNLSSEKMLDIFNLISVNTIERIYNLWKMQ